MEIIRKRIFARAGLLGNPSDGYHGKTIAISVRNYWSEVVLYEWDEMEIVLAENDRARFRSIQDLTNDVQLHGYYGGIRLVKATIKRFVEYCQAQGLTLHRRNFSVRYETNIPRQVGLAGSSSIIIATLRCLLDYYQIDMPLEIQPSFALSVETEELGIAAGLQDRVIQCYEDMVYMDFGLDRQRQRNGLTYYGYEPLTVTPPPLYLAITRRLANRPRFFTTTCAGAFSAANRTWWRRCCISPIWPPRTDGAAQRGRGSPERTHRREFRYPPPHLPPARLAGPDGRDGPPVWGQRQIRRVGRANHRHL